MTEEREELLEVLAKEANCSYLSDLRLSKKLSALYEVIIKIEAGKYTLKDWCDTVQYLSGEQRDFHTPEEAKAFLEAILEKQKEKQAE